MPKIDLEDNAQSNQDQYCNSDYANTGTHSAAAAITIRTVHIFSPSSYLNFIRTDFEISYSEARQIATLIFQYFY